MLFYTVVIYRASHQINLIKVNLWRTLCMPKTVNQVLSKKDVCYNRLIQMHQYWRKKNFLQFTLANNFENINFLKTSKDAIL